MKPWDYVNDRQREINPSAQAVHGISAEDLADKPTFYEISEEVAQWLSGSDLAGFNYITADIGDLQSYYQSREHKDIMVDIFRQVNPDLIFIQKPNDYMCDHVEVSKLVQNASFSASCPHYEMDLGPACKVTPLFYMENYHLVDCEPTEYVDITDELELKLFKVVRVSRLHAEHTLAVEHIVNAS